MKAAGFSWVLGRLPREERITWPSDGRYPDAVFDHAFVRGIGVQAVVEETTKHAKGAKMQARRTIREWVGEVKPKWVAIVVPCGCPAGRPRRRKYGVAPDQVVPPQPCAPAGDEGA